MEYINEPESVNFSTNLNSNFYIHDLKVLWSSPAISGFLLTCSRPFDKWALANFHADLTWSAWIRQTKVRPIYNKT